MSISADTLRQLAALALKPEQMAGVLTIIADMQEAEDARKTKQRERKARSRDKSVTVTGQERDGDSDGATSGSPDKKELPHTPLEKTNPLPLATLASVEARARDPIADDFSETFWPEYPHKVGKPAALRAFRAARKRVPLTRIMAGLQDYIRDKPPDRQWMNPATFLNQDRFDDQPASPIANRQSPDQTVLRSIARAVEKRAGNGGGQARPDERHGGEPDPAPALGAIPDDLEIPDYLRRH